MRTLIVFMSLAVGVTARVHAETSSQPLRQLIESFSDLNRLDYSNSPAPALKDLQAWHESTPEQMMRVAWMKESSVRIQERATVHFAHGMRYGHHFVYSWARQGDFRKHMPPERLTAIKAKRISSVILEF